MGSSNGSHGSNGMVPVASLDEVRARGVVVTQAGDRSVAVFAADDEIHAVDNRCPHMGFPLDRGSVKDGILTCHWHEARFELASGCTFDLWADDAISYATELRGDQVWVATSPRRQRDAAYHRLRLRRGMEMGVGLVQAKSLISLLGDRAGLLPIVASVVDYAAANVTNFGEGMVRLTCVARLAPWLSDETLYLGVSYAVRQLADEANAGMARRPRDPLAPPAPNAALKGWLRQWVMTRHRDAIERTLLAGVANGLPAADLADLLYGAAADRLYANTGHLFDACNKALELTDLLDGSAPDDLLALLAPALADARGEEESTPWHHPVEIAAAVRAAEQRLPALLANGGATPTGTTAGTTSPFRCQHRQRRRAGRRCRQHPRRRGGGSPRRHRCRRDRRHPRRHPRRGDGSSRRPRCRRYRQHPGRRGRRRWCAGTARRGRRRCPGGADSRRRSARRHRRRGGCARRRRRPGRGGRRHHPRGRAAAGPLRHLQRGQRLVQSAAHLDLLQRRAARAAAHHRGRCGAGAVPGGHCRVHGPLPERAGRQAAGRARRDPPGRGSRRGGRPAR